MKTRRLLASPAVARRWTALPYGRWTCADGREVIFNRFYDPIWQRIDGAVLAADSDEWVRWTSQAWFYSDGDIARHAELCRRLDVILAAFQSGEDVTAWLRTPKLRLHCAADSRIAMKLTAARDGAAR